ncbi:MAG: radical SAM protein [Chitinophagales bacterium]
MYNRHRKLGPAPKICYAADSHMHFNTDGTVTACCISKDFSWGKVNQQPLQKIWAGEPAKLMRSRLNRYEMNGSCALCKHQLLSGNFNAMQTRNYDRLFRHRARNYEGPTSLTLEVSNQCNLECVMCNGDFSHLIREKREGRPPLTEHYGPAFIDELAPFLPYLEKINCLGGEPFLIKTYVDLWEKLLRVNRYCRIHVQTNGTVYNDRIRNLLETGQFNVGVSIDSLYAPVYEQIRVNAKLQTVLKHVGFFSELARKGKLQLSFNFCPLKRNWMELPEMVKFADANHASLFILNVMMPKYESIRSEGPEKIREIAATLRHALQTTISKWSRNRAALVGFISQLESWATLADTIQSESRRIQELSSEEAVWTACHQFVTNHSLSGIDPNETNEVIRIFRNRLSELEFHHLREIVSNLIPEIQFFSDFINGVDREKLFEGIENLIITERNALISKRK